MYRLSNNIKMKVACIRQYDSYGDWMNSNGFIRYLLKEGIYDKLYVVNENHRNQEKLRRHCKLLYSDDSNIEVMYYHEYKNLCYSDTEFDVIDMRYPDVIGSGDFSHKGINYTQYNPLFKNKNPSTDKAENTRHYRIHGIDCEVKNDYFYFERKLDLEEKFYESLDIKEPYSIVCEYGENLIDHKYLKYDKVINLHKISPLFFDILKVVEECDDIHLIENSVSYLVYFMQYAKLMKQNKIHLHAYGRKEPHRRCDGPDSNNPTFNNLRCPSLENWEFIYE